MENFNTVNYNFELVNDNTKIVCHHYYGKNYKSTIKIACNIPNLEDKTLKKAVALIKKTITNEKKNIDALHGCTSYLDTISL